MSACCGLHGQNNVDGKMMFISATERVCSFALGRQTVTSAPLDIVKTEDYKLEPGTAGDMQELEAPPIGEIYIKQEIQETEQTESDGNLEENDTRGKRKSHSRITARNSGHYGRTGCR